MKLIDIKNEILKDESINFIMKKYIESMCINRRRPLGKFNPWAWWVEIVRGCNLRCWHCATRLFEKDYMEYMPREIYISLLKIIQELTPYSRLEFGQAGEPTLHPDFLEYIELAREICPNLQILTYTNGTTIISGKITYDQLFAAGLNMIFLDMYSPFEDHKKIIERTNYRWYHEDHKSKDDPNIFQYQNDPDIHIVRFSNNPSNWNQRKRSRGHMSTFFNDLDWDVAKKHGLKPVLKGQIERRCDFPCKFIVVNYDGTFSFCCWDYMRHTANNFGNIKNGIVDFFKFWLGQYMQDVRKRLFFKDRKSHEFCSVCSHISIRCDIPVWKDSGVYNFYWNGNKFQMNDKYEGKNHERKENRRIIQIKKENDSGAGMERNA